MQATNTVQREAVQDIWYGQIVIIVARWFLIGSGLVLTLWRAKTVGDITTPVYPLIALIAMNFLLHGRFITGSPMRREVVLASSIADIAIISAVILMARWDAGEGIDNPFFIFYYPVILAFALVFPWRTTALLTAATMAAYGAIILTATPDLVLGASSTYETLIARFATLASTAVLGSMYWRVQRQYRRSQVASR